MHNLPWQTMLPALMVVGVFSSLSASMIGLGGGLVAIPLISAIIGFDHSLQAKLISYVLVASLSLVAAIRYIIQKRKPDFRNAFFILLGVIPATVLCEIFVGPLFSEVPKYVFAYAYGAIVFMIILLINFKDRIPYQGIAPWWISPIFGVVVGALSGSFGLAGGVLFVPYLVIGLKMEPKQVAVNSLILKFATSLANISAGFGAGQYQAFEANHVFWWAPLAVAAGALLGANIGPIFNKRMTNHQIMIGFNVVLGAIFIWEITSATLMYENIL